MNGDDPWSQVEDIDGDAHYVALGVARDASEAEIRSAYRRKARLHHPDKGGDDQTFAAIQKAYEVLSDPKRRGVYDALQSDLRHRYVGPRRGDLYPGEQAREAAVLLDELVALGLHCDPRCQLVVVCEVCHRPATAECFVCRMPICDFCTRTRHWRGAWGLHWPTVDRPGMMLERLGKQEYEKKRIDDARRLTLADPNHRSEHEKAETRRFLAAAAAAARRPDSAQTYDLGLARYYMWHQTDCLVLLACFMPAPGPRGQRPTVELSGGRITIGQRGAPAVVERELWGPVAPDVAAEVICTVDGRVCAVLLPKDDAGRREPPTWEAAFRGDPCGARALVPGVVVQESDGDVTVEAALPAWVREKDVTVKVGRTGIEVRVPEVVEIRKTFWRDAAKQERAPEYCPVDVEGVAWSIDRSPRAPGSRAPGSARLLMHLPKISPTSEEVQYKRGVRGDNMSAKRPLGVCGGGKAGFRFFEDDEDLFGLEDVLSGLCFLVDGAAPVPTKPWDCSAVRSSSGATPWVRSEAALPAEVRTLIASLREVRGRPDDGPDDTDGPL